MFEAIHSSRTLPDPRTAIVSATVRFRALTIIGESSASGSTISSDDLVWPSPTCWDGELTIHTKRLKGPGALDSDRLQPSELGGPSQEFSVAGLCRRDVHLS